MLPKPISTLCEAPLYEDNIIFIQLLKRKKKFTVYTFILLFTNNSRHCLTCKATSAGKLLMQYCA